MLDSVFKTAAVIVRYRKGLFGPHLDGYVEKLFASGYGAMTIRQHVHVIDKLSHWMRKQNYGLGNLNPKMVARFLHSRSKRAPTSGGSELAAVRGILHHIEGTAFVRPHQLFVGDGPALELLREEYRTFLENERGLSSRSWRSQWYVIRKFLAQRFRGAPLRLTAIKARDISDYFTRLRTSKRRAQTDASALRSFFRFLLEKNRIAINLSASVPHISAWSDVGLPKYLAAEQVERLLKSCDQQTAIGRRDYAMLLLMARLGLRGTEIAALRLDDIDWRAGELVVRGKGKVRQRLPLLKDVGVALANTIKQDRRGSSRHVFVAAKAPRTGFVDAQAVTYAFSQALKRAEIDAPVRGVGSHVLRHSLATTMLRSGASLAEIGEVLRHQSPNTTTIYAKVDLDGLRMLAQPWPRAVHS
jgi:site-specific recombinase XerD